MRFQAGFEQTKLNKTVMVWEWMFYEEAASSKENSLVFYPVAFGRSFVDIFLFVFVYNSSSSKQHLPKRG
jgi:hypothetical protein